MFNGQISPVLYSLNSIRLVQFPREGKMWCISKLWQSTKLLNCYLIWMTLDVMLLITKTYLISGYSLELQKTHLNQLRFTCDGDVDNMLVMCRKVGQKVRI